MTNNKNAGYKVNFTTKTLTITKAFEEAVSYTHLTLPTILRV